MYRSSIRWCFGRRSLPISLCRGLPREDFIKLATWVDANAPYYGSYFGRRNLAHRNAPDFRPVPTLPAARGLRP